MLSLFASACLEPTVIGGAHGEGGGTGGNTPGDVFPSGVALLPHELPGSGESTTTSVGSTGTGSGPVVGDPETLFVFISSLGASCGNPYALGGPGCDTGWLLHFQLPVAYQTPGIYDLLDPQLQAFVSMEQADPNTNTCMGGGGSGLTGTIEVLSVDDDIIHVRVSGTSDPTFGILDGDYQVARCASNPTEPLPERLMEALALRGDQFPPFNGGGSSSSGSTTTGGGGLDPDTLFVLIGTNGATCADPYGGDEQCLLKEWRVSVGLPLAYQTPGVYSLSDPNLTAHFSEQSPGGAPGVCSGGGGSFMEGTVEVVSIDNQQLVVRFADVWNFSDALEQDIQVSRCP
ncbi:hypothetical protein [Chondromyces crocatus]|uniref:hypothetical protein n=1 Tax=Chondromyces crocatus TaxID=52 RepID=UPI00067B5951|nr:hypothetical protein [Chondromyces crocatus]